jgi:hypothetical protein
MDRHREKEHILHTVDAIQQGDTGKNSVRWLRVSYALGALVDGIACVQLLVPALFGALYRLPDFHPGLAYTYMAGTAASLMFGWTVLLMWGSHKPLERKGILLITVVPVILGLVVTEGWAVAMRFLLVGPLIPIWLLQGALILLFMYSYLHATRTTPPARPAQERAPRSATLWLHSVPQHGAYRDTPSK